MPEELREKKRKEDPEIRQLSRHKQAKSERTEKDNSIKWQPQQQNQGQFYAYQAIWTSDAKSLPQLSP